MFALQADEPGLRVPAVRPAETANEADNHRGNVFSDI